MAKPKDPNDHVPSIKIKCPTCGAVPDEECTEGKAGTMKLVPLHKYRTPAGVRLQQLNQTMSGAVFGGRKKGR